MGGVIKHTVVEPCICEYCGFEFERPHRKGRPPKFCTPAHKQRAYELRKVERLIEQAIESHGQG